MTTNTATVQIKGGTVRLSVEETVGPLGAFRSSGAAERCLASYADVESDRPRGVLRLRGLDGEGVFHVPYIQYDRPVRR